MKACIENYLNGNLADAKKQAKRISFVDLYEALSINYGYKSIAAFNIAQFLKGKITWQELCDFTNKTQKVRN